MTVVDAGASHRAIFVQRVDELARVLLIGDDRHPRITGSGSDAWTAAANAVSAVVGRLLRGAPPAELWLTMSALSTVLPSPDEFSFAARGLRGRTEAEATQWLLQLCLELAMDRGNPQAAVTIQTGAVLVEVDFSARYNLHTGIQRVVRGLLPRWQRDHDIVPVAWTAGNGALRRLAPVEAERVLRWPAGNSGVLAAGDDSADAAIVIPWQSTVVLAEVPPRAPCERLSALARYSGNRVAAIGYDCIPVISADMLPLVEPNKFVHYLSLLKNVHRVAGISESAAEEFRGFVSTLPAQGLAGPTVSTCALPAPAISEPAGSEIGVELDGSADPLVLCVGSFEPRKNQLAVLNAAERLWRDGLRFQLQFIGGGGVHREFHTQVKQLGRLGRPVSIATAISDDELDALYARARFSVFVSLHEGYGLPIAESFAHGVPVITSDYGSTAEVAAGGGALTVNPRDDDAICDAMRLLLTDVGVLRRLRADIALRPSRTWDDYAQSLWAQLVGGTT